MNAAATDNVARERIEATVAKMEKFSAEGKMRSWAECFAARASFRNSALPEAVLGREAIVEMTTHWPRFHNEIEWRVIEDYRMVIGWREYQLYDDGGRSGWYRGISTFVFDHDGLVSEYEGFFDLLALQVALKRS